MGEAAIASCTQEDRMFELLICNLAYDRRNELFAACSTAELETVDGECTPLEGLRQRLFEVIYSSEENEDL